MASSGRGFDEIGDEVTESSQALSGPTDRLAQSPVIRRAAGLFLFVIFLLYSRTTDVLGVYVPGTGYIIRTLSILLLIAVLMTGAMWRAFSSPTIKWLTAYTIWLVFAIPFSFWKAGSIKVVADQWLKAYLLTVAATALIVTPRYAKKALVIIGLATMQLGMLALLMGSSADRLGGLEGGLASNPNDLAFFVLVGIPSCILLSKSTRRSARIAGWLGVALLLVVAVKTGSRMGLIMIVTLFAINFLRQSIIGKVKLVAAATMVVLLALSFAPGEALDRYKTIWSSQDESTASGETAKALGSTDSRKVLFQLSLQVTLSHPLLGVGPGEFGDFLSKDMRNVAEKIAFFQTHNTYTQISSEAGLPALIFYLGALIYTLVSSLRLGRKFRKIPELNEYAAVADCIFLATAIYAVGVIFGSYAYGFFFPVLAGIAAGLDRSVAQLPLQNPPATDLEPDSATTFA
jgi:O-antigen ligase